MKLRLLVSLAVVGLAGISAQAAAANIPPPSSDPFYTYSGSLSNVSPGTVLRTRTVTLSVGGAPAAYPATQVLYRTTDQLGQPSATVATIIRPAGGAPLPVKLLSYQTFYDGVASTCRPSYTLQGAGPSSTTGDADESLILDYVQQGFTVVTSDYEGPTDDYGAGRESGQGTLDAIRAAEHLLGLTAQHTPVGLIGYSGGSIASEWASELAPSYAPELDLIGIAEGGIPVDYTHNLDYIDGSSGWAGAIPAVSIGLVRAYRIDFDKYLNAKGEQIVKQVSQGCLNPSAYPGLKLADMLKPQYKNWSRVPTFIRIFNDSIMGRAGTPKEPLLMAVGNADGTGDGVMVAKDVQELAYTYCKRGVPVQLTIYKGDDHVHAAIPFEARAIQFLDSRYAGASFASGCSSIGPGNELTPLPGPVSGSAHGIRLRYRGWSRRLHGIVFRLRTTSGALRHITLELEHGGKVLAKRVLRRLTGRWRRIVLHRSVKSGRYGVVVIAHRATALDRQIVVRRDRR